MTNVPRRLPPTQGQRIRNVTVTHASLSGQGRTAAARPVPQSRPTPQIYQAPTGLVTGRAGPGATSITSAGGGSGSSNASGASSIVIGDQSGPAADFSVVIGVYAYAYGNSGAAVGYNAKALGVDSTSIGPYTTAQQDNSTAVGLGAQSTGISATAVGHQATAAAKDSLALGHYAHANAPGSVAIGTDSFGIWAIANNQDEFVLGTAQHKVIVLGQVVMRDGSNNLRRLVIDGMTGAVSSVAYP